jgi:HK97 family phage major capsid protein
MLYTRKGLLALLTAQGLPTEPAPTLEITKAYAANLAVNGIELQGDDGKPLDIDAIWNQKSVVKLAAEPAASQVRGTQSPHAAITHNKSVDEPERFQGFNIGNSHRKAYAAKVARGAALFPDADHAEAFGAWGRLAIVGEKGYAEKANDLAIVSKAQVEYNNQTGGALVPLEFIPTLIYLTEQYGVARKLANVQPMSRDTASRPRMTGIASMTPIAETGTISTSDNSFGNVNLVAKKYGLLFQVSNELFADAAVNVGDILARVVAEAQAKAEDQAYFIADGSATYANQVGLVGALPSGAYIAQATSNTWATQVMGDLLGLIGSVENVDTSRLAFACSRQYAVQVMSRLDKATSQFKDLGTGIPGQPNAMFLGYPVFYSQVMPTATATSQKCLYFGDFMGGSMLGDRKQVEIATSTDYYFNADAIAVRGISRFNTVIHGDGRGSTYGPIVALKTS